MEDLHFLGKYVENLFSMELLTKCRFIKIRTFIRVGFISAYSWQQNVNYTMVMQSLNKIFFRGLHVERWVILRWGKLNFREFRPH